MIDSVLSPGQIVSFIEHGYLRIPECFTRADAQPWLDEAWVRLGYDPDDPSTWAEQRVHMPSLRHVEVADFAPKVWGAACQLLCGEHRIEQPYRWGNGFIANLGIGADRPWEPPSPSSPDWHKAGDFFRPFLASPEQGRRLLPPLPRLARAGPAHDRPVVGHRGARGRDVHRPGLRRAGGPAARAPPRGRAARRVPLRRADRAVLDLRGDHRPPGRRRAHAPLHAPRVLPEPPRHGAAHPDPADRAEGADALRPRRPGRALPGRARRPARPGRRAAGLPARGAPRGRGAPAGSPPGAHARGAGGAPGGGLVVKLFKPAAKLEQSEY